MARKYYVLVKKAFKLLPEVSIRQNAYAKGGRTYTITVNKHDDALNILMAIKLMDYNLEFSEDMAFINNVITKEICCKRAFIRGAFLAAGSISDPEKSYHFEIVCPGEEKAEQIKDIINYFEIDAKIVERKKHFVVYIKEGSGIVEILNVMEAHISLMDLENVRILKEMRNTVNRKVNCETANINKTVGAAVKQVADIEYIRDTVGLDSLPEQLYEMAILRLDNPEASLIELGSMLCKPVGKSGVNHRLRKLCEIADNLKEERNEG